MRFFGYALIWLAVLSAVHVAIAPILWPERLQAVREKIMNLNIAILRGSVWVGIVVFAVYLINHP